MRPHTAIDSRRIVFLKAVLKLMFLIMITAIVLVMGRGLLSKHETPPEPMRVNIAYLDIGGVQGVEWHHQRLLVVHPTEKSYLVIADYDPIYGCPLRWVVTSATEAPRQPWPGGFRALCTDHWFDAEGRSLANEVADLKSLPFTIEDAKTLVITATSK